MARRERELREKSNLTSGEDRTLSMSDDSGISSSSSPINGISTNNVKEMSSRYIRSNTINSATQLQKQQNNKSELNSKLTRAMSTPQIYVPTNKRFNVSSGQKGLMQRFIASRGKFSLGNNNKAKDSILVIVDYVET